jgi:microcystin-dependent protein
MAEPFLGEVQIFAFPFAPQGWSFCNGQLLPIDQNAALFSLLGTMYGGNGQTTFALPNLQNNVPIHMGAGAGLSTYELGQVGGQAGVVLDASQVPTHGHTLSVVANSAGDQSSPVGNRLGQAPAGIGDVYGGPAAANGSTAALPNHAGGQPHENRQPLLTLNFCISLVGIYPSQN